MTNTTLKALVVSILATKVADNAKIDYTQHGNGYSVCIRVPHINHITNRTEYSLPANFKVWGIQSEDGIKAKIDKFLGFNKHLVA